MKLLSVVSVFLCLAASCASLTESTTVTRRVDAGEAERVLDGHETEEATENEEPAVYEQPVSSEDVMCLYIQKLYKMNRVFNRFRPELRGSGRVKINVAISQAENGYIVQSMERLRAAVRVFEDNEGSAAARQAKVGARQARNLAQKMTFPLKSMADKETWMDAKEEMDKGNMFFAKGEYGKAATFFRKAVRTLIFSEMFPSDALEPPNCPPKQVIADEGA